jgi:hypothetical protein
MRIAPTKGKCSRCGHMGSRASIRQHLSECVAPLVQPPARSRRGPADVPALLIDVVGRPKAYWLFLGVAMDAKLSDVDATLRATWLECCGHLSEFVDGAIRYTSAPPDPVFAAFSSRPRPQSMRVRAGNVFRPGAVIEHHYDFGSTTILDLSLASPLPIALPSRTVALLANNEGPKFACGQCGRPATALCLECDPPEFLCAACSRRHARGHVPHTVVNSPRVGVCGYEGPGAP